VVTADALHTQRDHARWLVDDRNAAYLFTVKKNQPCLYRQLKQLPWSKIPTSDEAHDRGHGRYDIRRFDGQPANPRPSDLIGGSRLSTR
jgi:hypothetical protein